MATVLEPWASGGDVISGALALNLDQDGQFDEVLAVPLGEGFEELQTVALGVNSNFDAGGVLWRGLEEGIHLLESTLGQGVT